VIEISVAKFFNPLVLVLFYSTLISNRE